jgi:hypothetical protein
MLCEISCEVAGCVHQPIVDSESTIAAEAKQILSQLYLSLLSLPKPAKLNFFKTPTSEVSQSTLLRPLHVHYVLKYLSDSLFIAHKEQ